MSAKKTAAAKPAETVEVVEELVPDADAELAAAEAEATGDVIEVEHGGKTFILPALLDYPVDVVFAESDLDRAHRPGRGAVAGVPPQPADHP
ncbi:hypothetical protein ACR6C2_16805 [Streptomyces sp. INA 01156]